jgi:gas vesicle protein
MAQDQEVQVEESGPGRIAWFLTGVVCGLTIGLLFAPKSGKETRGYISQKTQEGADAVAETGRDVVERSREFYDKGRQVVDDAAQLFERGRKLVRG